MAYYNFPHTRNYDTDLGYIVDQIGKNDEIIEKLDAEVDAVIEDINVLDNDNTINKANIASLQEDNTTNKANIATNSADIKTLKEADFLKLVKFLNSENVTIEDHGKVNGVQSFTINVAGTTPINLTSNISFFNNSPQQAIISELLFVLDATNNKIVLSGSYYSNGVVGNIEEAIQLSSTDFKIVDNILYLAGDFITSTKLEEELTALTETFNTAIATKQDKIAGGTTGNLLYKVSDTEGDIGWTSITTGNLLTQDDIVNNLNSSSTTTALGAGQGKILNDKILDVENNYIPQGMDIAGTLVAGETTLALEIPTYSNVQLYMDIYTSTYGVNPTAVTVALDDIGQVVVTMTFEAQSNDLEVAIKVMGQY